jgi:hypothetical protein
MHIHAGNRMRHSGNGHTSTGSLQPLQQGQVRFRVHLALASYRARGIEVAHSQRSVEQLLPVGEERQVLDSRLPSGTGESAVCSYLAA